MGKNEVFKSFAEQLLETLFDFADVMFECMIDRKAAYRLAYGNFEKIKSRSDFCRELHNLKKSGYVKLTSKSIEFTNKAKLKVVEKIVKDKGGDNRNRFISFDIPEHEKRKRNHFRRFIKSIGFKKIQQSLWVINKDVSGLIDIICSELDIRKYVAYIVSEKTDIDEEIDSILKGQ